MTNRTATPRTDALAQEMSPVPIDECFSPMMSLARSLERDLQECVELLMDVRKKLCYGDGDPWRKRVDALLARLKERRP